MTNLYNLKVQDCEAVASLLDLFVYAEQKWCTWDKLEDSIAEVDYEKLSEEELNWFVEFLANCVMRVWRSSKEEAMLNQVIDKENCFLIKKYDWNAYKFARQNGADKYVTTPQMVGIDKDNLSEAEIKWLRSKCK